ncbi:MAG: YhcH/YjgK/YiaL family protein [Planctomycetaceae bacterium]|nr:YhcH/YjgK/YiaL family protein [Planctomycetaceae bacterium]
MILDSLDRAATYYGLGNRIAMALRYLQENDCTKLAAGRIPIDGDNVYALVQDYTSKKREDGVWEAHRRHIDVQFVAAGVEEMGYAPLASLTERTPYDEKKDFALFNGPGNFVTVPAGHFTIFFPQDGHIPGLASEGQQSPVRKVVVKVAL